MIPVAQHHKAVPKVHGLVLHEVNAHLLILSLSTCGVISWRRKLVLHPRDSVDIQNTVLPSCHTCHHLQRLCLRAMYLMMALLWTSFRSPSTR